MEADSGMPPTKGCEEWSTRRLYAAGLLGFLAALVVTVLVVTESSILHGIDGWTNTSTNDWARGAEWPVEIAAWIGAATGPTMSVIYSVVAVVGLAIARWNLWAILVAGAGISGVTIVEALKITIARPRPPGADLYVTDLDKSFPSGHATAGIYLYVCLALILILLANHRHWPVLRGAGVALFGFGILIGVSRIVLGVHWLSDVVGGWLFGSATLLVVLALTHPECQDPVPSTSEPDRSEARE